MAGSSSQVPRGGITDPNLTPLIDVSLVLVVILMVATPMAFQSGIAVQSAGAAGRAAAVQSRDDRIELTVMAGGKVRINKTVVDVAGLDAALRPLLEASASRRVFVHCDDDVTHGEFVHVLDEARALGASSLAVVEG